jgi:hypothetical protein
MSTRPSCAVAGCTHGSTLQLEEHAIQGQEQVDAVQGCIERFAKMQLKLRTKNRSSGAELGDHKREFGVNIMKIFEQFWCEPKHARLIDAKLVRFCFAYATETILKGDMEETVRKRDIELSRRLTILGIYLATWFKLGKDTFLGALRGLPLESSNQQMMLDFEASIGKLGTDRGMVLFLSKQIPCSCLDESEKNAKQAAKTRRCTYCSSEGLKMELKKCSQCKSVQYCSKECQVADWRAGHKKECDMWQRTNKRNAEFKAMHR